MELKVRTDRELAADLVRAESPHRGVDECFIAAENAILARLNFSLDETEQGLTEAAVDAISGFVSLHYEKESS